MLNDKNYRLSFTKTAEELVDKMSLREKVVLLAGHCKWYQSMGIGSYNSFPYGAGGNERLGISQMLFCDGPRGCVSGQSTCFPVSMARGATFDTQLEERVGNAIAKEIRANGGNFYGGVCINVPYNPGGGRSQETYGEDSVHIGRMASALIKGVQDESVIACIKHFAFNSMENSRFWVNITADKRTEREIYFRHFKECIDQGAAAVMSSYNRYLGHFNGANNYLLRDVLKGEWYFDGFVVSDFFFGLHNAAKGMNAGLDVEMNIRRKYTYSNIKRLLKKGKITEKQINEASVRIVRTILAAENARGGKKYPKELIACKEHIALSREVAEKSITLIKNENSLLPLDTKKIKRIAVVGDLAKEENIGDNGSSQVHPPYIKTVLGAFRESYPDVKTDFIPSRAVKSKQELIKQADAVIAVVGMKHSDEGEYIVVIGGDRKQLGLKRKEPEMLNTLGSLNKNTVAVVMGGNMIRVNEWQDSINSILFAYYPGMEGGNAIADIIFGKVNPGGKLPFVIGKADSDFPEVKWQSFNQHYDYYHGYKKLLHDKKEEDFSYGHGLSYTDFEISEPVLLSKDEKEASFSVKVKNIGPREGSETLFLFIGFNNSAVHRPERELRDFKRVYLGKGEETEIILKVTKSDLAFYKDTGFTEEDIDYTAFIGNSEKNAREHKITFRFGE
ncbi:MAG: glycoside hydrolase family 3 C-terminal domain-containing protein [Clostridia bacterium]|nr:glycoside hydrolase family 3 C-terminal domain-containing protein [Clostridia bacterium]